METKTRIPQVYGYAVCLTAIITFLICLTGLINNLIDASDPLYTWGDTEHLSSYDNFKLNALRSDQKEAAFMFDEESLEQMYEDAKQHKVRRVKHHTTKNIVVNTILLFISVILFIIHWVWMRKLAKKL